MATQERSICHSCVEDDYVKRRIKQLRGPGTCHYCRKRRYVVTIHKLGEWVLAMLEQHYIVTPTDPEGFDLYAHMEGLCEWNRDGTALIDVIEEQVGVQTEAASDIEDAVMRASYDGGSHESSLGDDPHLRLKEAEPGHLDISYQGLVRVLKFESKTLNDEVKHTLQLIFESIQQDATAKGPPIVEIGSGRQINALFRCRVFQQEQALKTGLANPEREVGPPPSTKAKAGRMNFQGISVFYGATEAVVALAEVRPPVGSYVVTGKFIPLRVMRILDIGALSSAFARGSCFDPEHVGQRQRSMFLRKLCREMTKPVMPESEAEEYLTTQVIAEYIASQTKLRLDGILYPSVQAGTSSASKNIVLFHNASRVIPPSITREISAVKLYEYDDETGEHLHPSLKERPTTEVNLSTFSWESIHADGDNRANALSLDTANLSVGIVREVTYTAETAKVAWRHTQPPPHAVDDEQDF